MVVTTVSRGGASSGTWPAATPDEEEVVAADETEPESKVGRVSPGAEEGRSRRIEEATVSDHWIRRRFPTVAAPPDN